MRPSRDQVQRTFEVRCTWWTILLVVGGLLFFWLVLLKLIMQFMKGRGEPCPSSWSWIVDNPLRRWDVRHALTRAELRPGGEIYLEEPNGAVIEAFEKLGHWGHAPEAAFRLSELEAVLSDAGLRITHRLKFGFGVYGAQKRA